MEQQFVLSKMHTALGNPVQYHLQGINGTLVNINDWIGRRLQLMFTGQITCQGCGKTTKKSFAQGFCYTCFMSHPDAEECVLRPELCKAHLGIARNLELATERHLAPHYVYLSYTSQVKVGVTRQTQVPTRWIDQGALAAVKVLRVPNRHIAGVAEVFFKQYFSDKSAWQKMLTAKTVLSDLNEAKNDALKKLPPELSQYASEDNTLTQIYYPVNELGNVLKSSNFDKQKLMEGLLTGIKGQYLILDHTNVVNVRRHTGYHVKIKTL